MFIFLSTKKFPILSMPSRGIPVPCRTRENACDSGRRAQMPIHRNIDALAAPGAPLWIRGKSAPPRRTFANLQDAAHQNAVAKPVSRRYLWHAMANPAAPTLLAIAGSRIVRWHKPGSGASDAPPRLAEHGHEPGRCADGDT